MMLSQNESLVTATHPPDLTFAWTPRPVNVWVAVEPYNPLQAYALSQLRKRLEAQGCIFVERPDQGTPLGPVAHLGIVFGKDLEQEYSPFDYIGQLPKPRGMVLVVNTVERIPDGPLFDVARTQLVRKSGHIGLMFEGDLTGEHVERALWGSMAGNNRLLDGEESTIFDSIALRMQAHVAAEPVNSHDGDESLGVTWDGWAASGIHGDLADAGRRLGAVGIIDDQVRLECYASGSQWRSVLRFLNRAALGEGMRSQIDLDLGIMGVTTTGGKKVTLSPDPDEGDVVPIGQLTWNGYVRAIPEGCAISYPPPSIETHENGMVYLASALAQAGIVHDFDEFYRTIVEHFARNERIRIVPEGLQPRVTVIEHFHRQPKAGTIKEPERVEVVYPDLARFPEIDFPCGARDSEMHLLSAVFRSKFFLDSAPMGNRAIVAVLPGHGSVALYGGPRSELIDLLVDGMEMEEIVRV
jgi:hypothetical protein